MSTDNKKDRPNLRLYKMHAINFIQWADTVSKHKEGWTLHHDTGDFVVPSWMCSDLATSLLEAVANGDAKAVMAHMHAEEPPAKR